MAFVEVEYQAALKPVWHEQKWFSAALDHQYAPEDYLNRAYDVVSDYVTYKEHSEQWDQQEKERFLQQIVFNIKTSLMERYHVTESSLEYVVGEDKHLYIDRSKKNAVLDMFRRGSIHRKHLGSIEIEREESEVIGFAYIDEVMSDPLTTVGTSIVSFSPRGIVTGTVYTGRFIDIFEKKQRDEEIYVRLTRKSVDYTYDEYSEKALFLNPSFFDGFTTQAADAWFLSHPIVTNKNIRGLFELGYGMSVTTFEEIFKDQLLQYTIKDYLKQITKPILTKEDRVAVAIKFNRILNRADDLVANNDTDHDVETSSVVFKRFDVFEDVSEFAAYMNSLGMRTPKTITGGGCPSSKGYNLFGSENRFGIEFIRDFYTLNSVSQFGLTNDLSTQKTWEYHTGNCVVCHLQGVPVGPCDICKTCEKKYD